MPENSASGSSIIYKYIKSTDELIPLKTIAKRPFTDAIIFNEGSTSYILSTELPNPNGQQLNIFKFNENVFEIESEPIQSVQFDNCRARNAGEIFICGNKIYRPAQDCNGRYGKE